MIRTIKLWWFYLPLAGLLFFSSSIYASKEDPIPSYFSVAVGTGVVANVPLPVNIYQLQQPNLNFTGHFQSRPFDSPYYYQIRLAWWKNCNAWEVEFLHQKLYLTHNPPDVQFFQITHGYNLLMINRAFDVGYFIWRLGLGMVITHPENTVRYQRFQEGYYISGPVAQVGIEERFHLTKNIYIYGQVNMTAAAAYVPVYNGDADVPNIAFHFLTGLGYDINL